MSFSANIKNFTAPRPKTGIIGHRGIAALAPENTLSSFQLAFELGIDYIEFDVRLTKDNQLIIFHDDTLERTTNGQGNIEEKTFQEISQLDAGSWFDKRFANERIPHFDQVLPLLLNLPLSMNIELKFPENPTFYHVETLAKQFIQIMNKQWPIHHPWPLVSSFHWPVLDLIRSSLPSIPLGFLTETCSEEIILEIAKIPNAALHTHFTSLTPNRLKLAKDLELPLLVFTVNETQMASQLFDADVFAVFSDRPLFMVPSS